MWVKKILSMKKKYTAGGRFEPIYVTYGDPVGRGYEQWCESKNPYEQRSESKIAYGPRAKLRTVREQN